jgi:hypothetical protein
VNVHQLAPDEPLSPELVLVFPPELRAQALASLPAPVWTAPRLRLAEAPAPAVDDPYARSFGAMVLARFAQLALVFAAITILTLAMSVVAQAFR